MKRIKTELSWTTKTLKFRRRNNNQGREDRLSSLPDSLLVSILSLLKVKEAASTSVLSHCWTHLWTRITRLQLSYDCFPEKSYVSTVDRIFGLLTSNKIHTFDLQLPYLGGIDTRVTLYVSALVKWFDHVFAHNVEEIKVSGLGWHPNSPLPTSIFICPSLLVLELTGRFPLKFPDDGIISLPNLKKLLLHRILDWDYENMSKLFKSCPVLEVLDLEIRTQKGGGQRIIDVSCQNLRSLKIYLEQHMSWNYIINAPKLELFDVNGIVSSFRFVENPCFLTKAKIKFLKVDDEGIDHIQTMSGLLEGICSVQSLELTSVPLCPLVHLDANIVPNFHNLTELHISLNDTSVCKNLFHFFICAPNLEVLIIDILVVGKGVRWDVPDSDLFLSRKIKKVKMTGLEGSKQELKFLMYILRNANELKSVFVGVLSRTMGQLSKEARFSKKLFSCPRSSKDCVIDFQGKYLHASSADKHSHGTLKCEIHHLY